MTHAACGGVTHWALAPDDDDPKIQMVIAWGQNAATGNPNLRPPPPFLTQTDHRRTRLGTRAASERDKANSPRTAGRHRRLRVRDACFDPPEVTLTRLQDRSRAKHHILPSQAQRQILRFTETPRRTRSASRLREMPQR